MVHTLGAGAEAALLDLPGQLASAEPPRLQPRALPPAPHARPTPKVPSAGLVRTFRGSLQRPDAKGQAREARLFLRDGCLFSISAQVITKRGSCKHHTLPRRLWARWGKASTGLRFGGKAVGGGGGPPGCWEDSPRVWGCGRPDVPAACLSTRQLRAAHLGSHRFGSKRPQGAGTEPEPNLGGAFPWCCCVGFIPRPGVTTAASVRALGLLGSRLGQHCVHYLDTSRLLGQGSQAPGPVSTLPCVHGYLTFRALPFSGVWLLWAAGAC